MRQCKGTHLTSTIAAMVGLLSAVPVAAQVETRVSDPVACARCEIVLTPVATIGKLSDDVALSMGSLFAVDPERRLIYAFLTYTPGTIALYDWNGNFVRTFGRPGQGPGEFGSSMLGARILIDERGRLHVVESGRRTIVDAALRGTVSARALEHAYDFAAALPGGRLIMSASTMRRTSAPYRFIMLDSTGTEIGRYGTMPPDPGAVNAAPALNGGFWAAHLSEYRLDLYNRAGELERIIRRDAAWFPGRTVSGRPSFGRAWQESANRVWTAVRVPDANEARARAARAETNRMDQLDWNAVEDTYIEVIDPVSGRLLASRRFDQVLVMLNNGYVVQHRQTPEGLVQVIVSSLSLRTNVE